MDVTDPKHPKYLFHIPGEPKDRAGEFGGASMVRVCSGNDLPHGDRGKYYMLRAFGNSAHEIWDVTDPAKPSRLTVVVSGLRDTHKNWWECDTGIAYLVSGPVGWRVPRMMQIYDLSDPAKPVFIRNFGLPGQEPSAKGPTPGGLHGAFSTGPKGNRVYLAYDNARDGVIEIVDREKLLNGPKEPTEENLRYPIISRVDLPDDMGAHNIVPMLHMALPEFADQKLSKVKDFMLLIGETTANECQESRQMARIYDITTETKPVGVSTLGQFPRIAANFCSGGQALSGTHSTNENLTPIYANRVVFVAHFNAGVRAVDIRDPYKPKEIGYTTSPPLATRPTKRCVGEATDQNCKVAVQTNNVDVDDRQVTCTRVDRAATPCMHIVELTGAQRARRPTSPKQPVIEVLSQVRPLRRWTPAKAW